MPRKKKPPTKPDARRRKTLPRVEERQDIGAKDGISNGPFTDDPLGTEDDEAADDDESFDPYETP